MSEDDQAVRLPGVFLVGQESFLHGSRSFQERLVSEGFRVHVAQSDPQGSPMQVLAEYGAFSSDPEEDARSVFLVGYDGSGDWIAREYYALYPRNPPIGAVLLSSPARVLHLNRLTVPFLVVHGHQDPRFSQDPEFWTRLQEGVHHHQARYGDATRSLSFPIYGKELGAEGIGSDVVEEVISWMRKVLKEPSRPQEDLTSGNLRKTG